MFGPGDKFGEGRFGDASFARRVLFESLPAKHRELDEENGSPLKLLFEAVGEEIDLLRDKIKALPLQRDPSFAFGGNGGDVQTIATIADAGGGKALVTLESDHDFETGNRVSFAGVSTGTPTIVGTYEVLETKGPENTLTSKQFTITATMTVTATDGKVKLKEPVSTIVEVSSWQRFASPFEVLYKDVAMVEFSVPQGVDLESLGVGYKALFTPAKTVTSGSPSSANPAPPYEFKVLRITRRSDLPHTILCAGRVISSDDTPSDPLVLNFIRPSTLSSLARDFGILFDEHLPEQFQRSSAKNIVEFVKNKSSEKGYQIRAESNGFEAQAQGLFHLDSNPGFPSARVFTIEDASGTPRLYTDIEPRVARFDELAADAEGIDYESGADVYPTDLYAFDDTSRLYDKSPLLSWFQCIGGLTLTAVTDAPQATLALYDLPYGKIVSGVMPAAQRAKIADFSSGKFSISGPFSAPPTAPVDINADEKWPIERELAYDSTTGLIELLVGVPDTVTISTSPTHWCVEYEGGIELSCDFCKSHVVRLSLTATTALKEQSGFSGAEINKAKDRVVERILLEQLPIHARLGETVINHRVEVTRTPPSVQSVAVEIARSIVVAAMDLYDVTPADEVATDETRTVSVTVT